MYLYLVRHGAAVSPSENPERPLSDAGATEVTLLARAVSKHIRKITRIYHSGKRRAKQTADILSAHLQPTQDGTTISGLQPSDDPEIVQGHIQSLTQHTIFVGHLPHLAKLTARLLGASQDHETIHFATASMACLAGEGARWQLLWHVQPALFVPAS